MCRFRFILAVILSVLDRAGSGASLLAIVVRVRENLGIKKDGTKPSKISPKIFLKNLQKGLDIWVDPCYYDVTAEASGRRDHT